MQYVLLGVVVVALMLVMIFSSRRLEKRWYHRKFKVKGDPDIGPDEARQLYDEWQGAGCPTPDSKKPRKRRGVDDTEWWEDLLDIIIPVPPLLIDPNLIPGPKPFDPYNPPVA